MADSDVTLTEEWRAIEGWPYEVSNMGRVRRAAPGGNSRIGRILRPRKGPYLSITLCKDNIKKQAQIHTLVCEAFHGPKPSGKRLVAHYDGDGHNNRYDNLRWATVAENAADAARHGRIRTGSRNSSYKVPWEVVCAIREAYDSLKRRPAPKGFRRKLIEKYGVNGDNLHRIINRETRLID